MTVKFVLSYQPEPIYVDRNNIVGFLDESVFSDHPSTLKVLGEEFALTRGNYSKVYDLNLEQSLDILTLIGII